MIFREEYRMKKNVITILLISLAIILCSCDNETEELSQYNETTNQHISDFGISLQIPKEWEEETKWTRLLAVL